MLVTPKFLEYEDINRKVSLCDHLEDIEPYHVTLPDPPKPEEMINFGQRVEDQTWTPPKPPEKVLKLDQLTHKEAFLAARKDPEIGAFIEKERRRFEEGVWIYINGRPTYMTGLHYFYCTYFHMDIGLPRYRSSDRDNWYWWEFAVKENKSAFGGIEISRRREGKTYRAGCRAYYESIRGEQRQVGIQSKTKDDAKKTVFQKCIVNPWTKMPFWLRPMYDNTEYPRSELHWRVPTQGGSDRDISQWVGSGLQSWIEARASTEEAFDGTKLHFYVMDEAGKTTETDVVSTWDFVKPTLTEDFMIVGKAIITTTVEEMEKKGGYNFKLLWDKSCRIPGKGKVNELGQTVSGMVPYFNPSYNTYLFDQYGNAIINDPTEEQSKYLKSIGMPYPDKGGRELLTIMRDTPPEGENRASVIRKYPFSIKECFRKRADECHFDLEILLRRQEKFIDGNPYVVTGDFEWKDGPQTPYRNGEHPEVIWKPKKHGKFNVSYLLPQDEANRKELMNGYLYPANTALFSAGADPFKYPFVKSTGKASKGGLTIYMNFDPEVDRYNDGEDMVSDDFILSYLYREKTPTLFIEDVLKACLYYGCQVYPEINVSNLWETFIEWGYMAYLAYGFEWKTVKGRQVMVRAKHPGQTNRGENMREPLFAYWEEYVEKTAYRCKHEMIIDQLIDAQYDDLSPYDIFVAGGYNLYWARKFARRHEEVKKVEAGDISGIFKEIVY